MDADRINALLAEHGNGHTHPACPTWHGAFPGDRCETYELATLALAGLQAERLREAANDALYELQQAAGRGEIGYFTANQLSEALAATACAECNDYHCIVAGGMEGPCPACNSDGHLACANPNHGDQP